MDLATEVGREAHRREVWGPPSRQERLRALVRTGAVGSGVGGALELLDCAVGGGESLAAVIAGILLVGLLFATVRYIVDKVTQARRRRQQLRPFGAAGALPGRPASGPRDAKLGVAEGAPQPSPLNGDPCLAYSIVLRSTRPWVFGKDVLWREATSHGFSVRLDDDTRVRIPAGLVRIVETARGARRAARDQAAAWLPAGLTVDVPGELPELPFDDAAEETIRPNDRIAILSPIELREDRDGLPASPRTPAKLVPLAIGVPVLKRCEPG